MSINKVVYGSTTLIDLTADTVTKDKILAGFTAHDASGAVVTGTCSFDVNSQDADVKVAEVLDGKTFYARGSQMTGTMPNNGSFKATINTVKGTVSIPAGFHDGSGNVSISTTEAAKLIAGNIKQGITILGVTGTLEPSSSVKVTSKTVTPTKAQQVVTPGTGFDYLAQVTVNAIPYSEADNAAGGKTVTIG